MILAGSYSALMQILNHGGINYAGCNFDVVGTPNIGDFNQAIGAGCSFFSDGATFSGNTAGLGGTQYNFQG